jgi:DNA gyrase/topoisomerase IV subunit A
MENKSKEVEEAMALLMKTQKEREEIEQNREELMRRIEDEKEKTSLYREAIIQLKENLEDEKKSKELMEEGTTRHDTTHDALCASLL